MEFHFLKVLVLIVTAVVSASVADARPYSYPAIRYENAESEALGGVTLPLSDELGNDLMNNPAGLARNTKFRIEALNLGLEGDTNLLSGLGMSSTKMTGLGGMSSTLNQNPGKTYGGRFSNLSAVQWGGLGIGVFYSKSGQAVSDGTTVQYATSNQFIPMVGYGLKLARGVVRIGASVQYVNQVSGIASAPSDSSASFASGVASGHGLSSNASVNFVFPFEYLPTFSVLGRNLGGLHYQSGSMLMTAQNSPGLPPDENMSVDLAFNFTVRLSGSFKSFWYFQYKDMTSTVKMPMLERLNSGVEFAFNKSFSIRGGVTGTQPSAGIGYRSDGSEINLAWYAEQNPLSNTTSWDTRYSLQYKLFFQDKNTRERDSKGK